MRKPNPTGELLRDADTSSMLGGPAHYRAVLDDGVLAGTRFYFSAMALSYRIAILSLGATEV